MLDIDARAATSATLRNPIRERRQLGRPPYSARRAVSTATWSTAGVSSTRTATRKSCEARESARGMPSSAVMASFTALSDHRDAREPGARVGVRREGGERRRAANTSVGAPRRATTRGGAGERARPAVGANFVNGEGDFILDLTDRRGDSTQLEDDVPKLALYGLGHVRDERRSRSGRARTLVTGGAAHGRRLGGVAACSLHPIGRTSVARAVLPARPRGVRPTAWPAQTAQWSPTSCALRDVLRLDVLRPERLGGGRRRRAARMRPERLERHADRVRAPARPAAAVADGGSGSSPATRSRSTLARRRARRRHTGRPRRHGDAPPPRHPHGLRSAWFREVASGRAVLEVDGERHRRRSRRSSRSARRCSPSTQDQLPLWYDDGDALLRDGEHLLRVRPRPLRPIGAAALAARPELRRAHDRRRRPAAREDELLHGPNVAGYVGGCCSGTRRCLTGRCRRSTTRACRAATLAASDRPSRASSCTRPRSSGSATAKGSNGRFPCEPWWIGDASCEELRAHKRAQFAAEGRGAGRWRGRFRTPRCDFPRRATLGVGVRQVRRDEAPPSAASPRRSSCARVDVEDVDPARGCSARDWGGLKRKVEFRVDADVGTRAPPARASRTRRPATVRA